ncbi:signal peptide peptidase SppA [Porphyromonadaceae bacterium W3.11]|nr:signal peptide peptidase SppA [Porphyromonadaceae bacterium W3.11]
MKQFLKMLLASCLGVLLAGGLVVIIFFAVLSSAIGGVMDSFSGKGEEKPVSLSSESVLLIDQVGVINDTPIMDDPFVDFGSKENKSFTLQEIVRAINVARENPSIEAIVLKLENSGAGFGTAYEIREALLRFKESGKKIYAYSDSYNLGTYYISSVADKVYAGPKGMMAIEGINSSVIFKKGLLEKLGAEVQVFKVGTFKSAVEPIMLDKMSPENRLQVQEMIDGLWVGTTSEIAKSRGIERSVLDEFVENVSAFEPMEHSVALNLIDSLVYRVDIDDVLAEKIVGDRDVKLDYRRVGDVLRHESRNKSSDKVAVIYAEGNIVQGTGDDGDNPFKGMNTEINESLVSKLRKAAEDEDIKAVVLRVNSGGGAATTSEMINHELQLLKAKKPVVVSMGNYAASGGYMISAPANLIVADPYTLTGSIGIFGVIPNLQGTMKKIGLREEEVSTSEVGSLSIIHPMNAKQKEVMQKNIERGYDEFITLVSEGRGVSKAHVDSVGQGRVWLGSRAIDLGLVDKLGGLQMAIEEAARLAELDSYRVVHRVDKISFFKKLMGTDFQARVHYLFMPTEDRILHRVNYEVNKVSGVQAIPPYRIENIQAAPIESFQL